MYWVKKIVSADELLVEWRDEQGKLLGEDIKSPVYLGKCVREGSQVMGYIEYGVYQEYSYTFDCLLKYLEKWLTRGVVLGRKPCGTIIWDVQNNILSIKISGKEVHTTSCSLQRIDDVKVISMCVDVVKREFRGVHITGSKRWDGFTIPEGYAVVGSEKATSMTWGGIDTVFIPDTVDRLAKRVFAKSDIHIVKSARAFKEIPNGCFTESTIKKVEIPGVEKIAGWAFADCEDLIRLDIGNDVREIGDMAFRNVEHLKPIDLRRVTRCHRTAFEMWGEGKKIIDPLRWGMQESAYAVWH